MNHNKKYLFISLGLLLAFVFYTLLVRYVDVADIGPRGSEVGFSTLNYFFHEMFGMNSFWYHVTKYLGIVPFLLVAFYGVQGFLQLIKTKSIMKVDKELLFLGGLYILLGITYLVFEKIIINYRPVLLDGELEASYPSSHTMLALVICLSSLMILRKYIINRQLLKYMNLGTIFVMLVLVIGRALSGVHWISDIFGGILISLTLVSFYFTAIKWQKK